MDTYLIEWLIIGAIAAFVVLAFGCFLFFFAKYRKSEAKTKIQVAFLIFFICWGITRAIQLYFDHLLGLIDPGAVINSNLIWKISFSFLMGGFGSVIFASENAVFNGKDYYALLIGFMVVFSIGLLYPDVVLAQTFMVFAMFFALIIPISYFYLAYKYPLSRRNITIMFVGFAIFCVGVLMLFSTFVNIFPTAKDLIYLSSAVIQLVGFGIFAIGVKRMYFAR